MEPRRETWAPPGCAATVSNSSPLRGALRNVTGELQQP